MPKKLTLPDDWATLPKTRAEAHRVGATHYFTGEPCVNGHRSPRFRAGLCVACSHDRHSYQQALATKHGVPKYFADTYCNMVARCTGEWHPAYKDYGGRGIFICDEWLGEGGFIKFVNHLGPRPPGFSIERENVNGPYSPDNCRWADRNAQRANQRRVGDLTQFTKIELADHIATWPKHEKLAIITLIQRSL